MWAWAIVLMLRTTEQIAKSKWTYGLDVLCFATQRMIRAGMCATLYISHKTVMTLRNKKIILIQRSVTLQLPMIRMINKHSDKNMLNILLCCTGHKAKAVKLGAICRN